MNEKEESKAGLALQGLLEIENREPKKAERLAISDKTFGDMPKARIERATSALRMRCSTS